MPQPQSGISKSSLLLLGGLTALLASPSARAKIAGLVQDAASGAYTLLDETVAPAAQQAAHTVAVRAGELTEEAKKVAANAQDHLPGLLADVREQAAVRGQQLFDSTSDLRGDIAHRAAEAAAAAAKTASTVQSSVQDRFSDVQQEAAKRRDALLDSASDVQDTLSHKLGGAAETAHATAQKVAQRTQKAAVNTQKDAKKTWLGLLDTAQDEVQDVRGAAQKKLKGVQKDVRKKAKKQIKQQGKKVTKQAAKTAEQGRRAWLSFADDAQDTVHNKVQSAKADALKAAEAQFKDLKKGGGKQLKKYEKHIQLLNKELAKTTDKQLKKAGLKKRRRSSAVMPVLFLVGGGVALARIPAARQGILNAVGAVSPGAEDWLRGAGRSVRNLIGTAWLERMEDVNHAPAAAAPSPKPSQATGSAAGASVAPDAPAAAPATPAPTTPPETKVDTQSAETGKTDAGKDTKTN
ncbi:hypothetical protein FNU79_05540 [Deinococcus detaillensis]|uniref:Alginate biosynthesis protein AlgP n=1 Tax=Deinococcus detaillensis TaxID=2592048 RepID=A0A553V4N3_9DEIO|nr:hypothetical protein [Deinococcus detaillensis]TSA87344.1 hypothetical protein FNU79_05540 [Deinococcus detaillensis]